MIENKNEYIIEKNGKIICWKYKMEDIEKYINENKINKKEIDIINLGEYYKTGKDLTRFYD